VEDAIEPQSYDHILKLSGSDHKPVFSLMNVKVKDYDVTKMKRVQMRVERELKKSEDPAAPVELELSEQQVDFGKLQYKQPKVHEFTLSNHGSSNAYFRFLSKPEDAHVSKRLFNVSPAYGLIKPGEVQTISVEALIDAEAAHVVEL
jgi:hypothetical protein